MGFAVLASGSRGNASWVRCGPSAVLIDLGVSARSLIQRLHTLGAADTPIVAAVLTHTHCDHVQDSSLSWLHRESIPLSCHPSHVDSLRRRPAMRKLMDAGLVATYDDRPWMLPNGVRVEPIPLSHDDDPTIGFRIECRRDRRSPLESLAYILDTGTWDDTVADAASDVSILALEFNHDVELQRHSGRPPFLIRRILGDQGHLSNEQAAGLLRAALDRTSRPRLRCLALLHLSEQCNHPRLAEAVALHSLREAGSRASLVVGEPERPSRVIQASERGRRIPSAAPGRSFECT